MKKWKLEELVEDLNYENDMLAGKIEELEKRNKSLEFHSKMCEMCLNIEKSGDWAVWNDIWWKYNSEEDIEPSLPSQDCKHMTSTELL